MGLAARVGDLTGHGTPLGPGPGSVNVLIGGQPAWRAATDTHTCPLTSPSPHGGGMVAMGSTTVLINNFPAARQGDLINEVGGGPDPISMGCPTVMIGG